MKRCVLRHGLQQTTIREISDEAGFTTGVISYYFPDTQSVIRSCFETVSNDWLGGVQDRLGRASSAHARIVDLVVAALPDDLDGQREWRLWAEMWVYAGSNPDFASVLVEVDSRWERYLVQLLNETNAAGLLRTGLDLEFEATIIVRLVDGLGLRAWLNGDWNQARRQFAYHLTSLVGDHDLAAELSSVWELPESGRGKPTY